MTRKHTACADCGATDRKAHVRAYSYTGHSWVPAEEDENLGNGPGRFCAPSIAELRTLIEDLRACFPEHEPDDTRFRITSNVKLGADK